jgi:hypothetical protein
MGVKIYAEYGIKQVCARPSKAAKIYISGFNIAVWKTISG